MKCLKCNADLNDGVLFCTACGTKVDTTNNNVQTNSVVQESVEVNSTDVVSNTTPTNNVDFNSVNNINQPVNEVPLTQPASPMEYNSGVKENNNLSNNTKKSNVPILIAVIALVLLVGICVGGYFILFNSPKKVFTNILNTSKENISEVLNSNSINAETVSTTFDFKTNVKAQDAEVSAIFEMINNISLNGNVQMDYKNKVGKVEINSNYESEELINLEANLMDGNIYILLKDVYSKYISTNVDDYDLLFETNESVEDYNIIINEAVNAVNESLKDEYFSTEKTTLNIDGKDVSVKKNILTINQETFVEITTSVLTKLKSNDKFLDSLSKVSEITKDELISSMEDEIESFDDTEYDNSEVIELIIYTEGLFNSFAGIELIIEEDSTEVKMVKTSETAYSFEMKSSSETISGTVNITNKDDKTTIIFNIIMDGDEVGFELSYNVKYNEAISVEKPSNNVDINNISDTEYNNIFTNLMNKKGVQNLINDMESLNTYDTGYGYDYDDYDYSYDSDYSYDYSY